MAVYDRWHRDGAPGEQPCKCGRGRNRLYPSSAHGKGDRWQVRWRDPDTGKQKKRNFAARDGADPNTCADAFDKTVQGQIVRRDYTDPSAGQVSLREYAEKWRAARTHGESAARGLEGRLRNHVYESEPGGGVTPSGAVAIGQHPVGLLARRPSMIAAWMASLPLADSSRRLCAGDLSAVFRAAVDDGIVGRDPVKAGTVDRPRRGRGSARPYAASDVAAVAACMPGRFALVPYLGALTGMREMEMAGLGADDVVRGRRPKVRVVRQLKLVDGALRWGPVKNRRPHDVPAPPGLIEMLDAHMAAFPPLPLTLPWHEPGSRLHGAEVTVRLVLSREDGTAATRNVMDAAWRTGVARWLAPRTPGGTRARAAARGNGIHRLRHTFASTQLRAGVDVVRVAAWMGDTVDMVTRTYAHLLPDDHDGDEAGRSAAAAFLSACAPSVPRGPRSQTFSQVGAL